MFVAQVVGKSMEPAIPDGSYCLFRAPVEGTRQGKTVLVQLRDATDPETGQRYTVKRYESEKATQGDSWRHDADHAQADQPRLRADRLGRRGRETIPGRGRANPGADEPNMTPMTWRRTSRTGGTPDSIRRTCARR